MNKLGLFNAIVALIVILIANIVVYEVYFDPYKRIDPDRPNIPEVIKSYFTDLDKLGNLWENLLFGEGLQGSSKWVKLMLLPISFLPLYIIEKKLIPRKYWFIYSTFAFIILMIGITFIGATIDGIAQAEDWYYLNVQFSEEVVYRCGNETITTIITGVKRIQGTFDFAPHWIFGLFFAGWAAVIDIPKLLGIRGNYTGRIVKYLVIIGLYMIVSMYFEHIEFVNPENFTNFYGNSLADIGAGLLGVITILFIYDQMVLPKKEYEELLAEISESAIAIDDMFVGGKRGRGF